VYVDSMYLHGKCYQSRMLPPHNDPEPHSTVPPMAVQASPMTTPGGAAAGYSRSVVKGGFPTYCTRFAGVTASSAGPALGAALAAGVARTCFRAALR
jgi:hypothetical protein